MAVILDATFGGKLSNAYSTLADVNSFIATTLFSNSWDGIGKDQREVLILTATRSIDQKNWAGSRFYLDQELEFPRTLSVPLPRSTPLSAANIEWNRMLKRVKEAVAIQAVWEHLRQSEVDYRFLQSAGLSSVSQGGGNTNMSLSFSHYAQVLHPDVRSLLRQWRSSPRVLRG